MSFIKKTLIITSLSSALLWALPAAALTDMHGKETSFEALTGKGKWTVFELWASDCRMCQSSIKSTNQFQAENPSVDVYSVSLDGVGNEEAAQEFIDTHQITYPSFIADPVEMDTYLYKTVKASFVGTPTLFLYDPQGKLVVVQPGEVSPEELSRFIKGSSDKSNTDAQTPETTETPVKKANESDADTKNKNSVKEEETHSTNDKKFLSDKAQKRTTDTETTDNADKESKRATNKETDDKKDTKRATNKETDEKDTKRAANKEADEKDTKRSTHKEKADDKASKRTTQKSTDDADKKSTANKKEKSHS